MSNTITMEGGSFSTIPNELLNNASISLSAKGMYVFMRGKPAAWNFTIRSMAKQLKEGETAISNALNELKKYGWISYTKLSNGKGVYHLFWTASAETQEDPNQGNHDKAEPKPEKPNQGYPMKGKPQRISNKEPIVKKIDSNKPIVCNKSHTTDSAEQAFEVFWRAGMRKINKKRALSLFTGICKRKKLDPMQFAEQLASDVRKRVSVQQMGFDRMHPTTYLSNERWSDEVVSGVDLSVNNKTEIDFESTGWMR